MTLQKDGYTISTDKDRLDLPFIHGFLRRAYWSENIPVETVARAIEGSLCFGIYEGERQVGFARVVTDQATFGYLADVFVIEEYRGRGLSKWLMEVIMAHPGLQGLRNFMLATRDAHGLYAQYGFVPAPDPSRVMQILRPDLYKQKN